MHLCVCLSQMWSNVVRKQITWSGSTKSLISSFTDESGWCGHMVSCDPGNQKRSNQTLAKTSKEWKLLSWKCVLFDLDWSTRSLRSSLRMGGGEWEDLAKSKIGKKFERNLGVTWVFDQIDQIKQGQKALHMRVGEKIFTHWSGRKKLYTWEWEKKLYTWEHFAHEEAFTPDADPCGSKSHHQSKKQQANVIKVHSFIERAINRDNYNFSVIIQNLLHVQAFAQQF